VCLPLALLTEILAAAYPRSLSSRDDQDQD
jgi:hypothetical protein